MKRIGYMKTARSLGLDPNKHGFQGDAEAPNLLRRLAVRHPEVTFVVAGRNTGGTLGLPNIENPWDTEYTGPTFRGSSVEKGEEGFVSFRYNRKSGNTTEGKGYVINPEGLERDKRMAALIASLDGIIIHAGNMGTSHIPIPQADVSWARALANPELLTEPQQSSRTYGGFITEGLNALGDRTDGKGPVVWLCPDPRNYVKDRSLKWPTGCDEILAQYAYTREGKHERFRDTRRPSELGFQSFCTTARDGELWVAKHKYIHDDLELMILPDDWETWGKPGFYERAAIGLASTSFAAGTKPYRSQYVRDWLLKNFPGMPVWGKWDDESLAMVPPGTVQQNEPEQFQSLLESWRVTAALPALGSKWTVAKPYQCFAANVVCLMLDFLDDQGWVMPARVAKMGTKRVAPNLWSSRDDWTTDEIELAGRLRCSFPIDFAKQARYISESEELWTWCVTVQRGLLRRRFADAHLERTIATRLGL